MAATLNNWAGIWWAWMAPMFWQVSLLIVLIGVLDWAGRRWVWPQVRYAVWLLVLLKLVLPPTLASPVSVFSRVEPGLRSVSAGTAVEKLVPAAASARLEPETAQRQDRMPLSGAFGTSPVPDEESAAAGLTAKTRIFLVWIGGMAVFAFLLILKMARLRRWHRQHRDDRIPDWFYRMLVETAKTLRLGRVPAIVFAPDAATPAVYGMFRPVLLLPSGYLKNLSRDEARHVLLHELSHLKRGDLWMHGLYLVLHVVYWFNPLLIWARRQMKHVREICCDLSVAGVLREKTRGYRDTLLNTAKDLLTENVEPGLGLLGVFEEPFRLVTRLKWLEKDVWKRGKWITAASVSASVCAAAAFLPMAPGGVSLLPDDPARTVQFSSEGPVVLNVTEDGKIGPADFRIRLETTEPRTVVLLPCFGRINPQIEGALTELKERMEKQGLKPRGDYFFRVWTDGQIVPDEQSIWEVGCPVASDTEAEPPLEIARIPEMREAVTDVRGMPTTVDTWEAVTDGKGKLTAVGRWNAFIDALSAEGLVPAFPPAVEVYRDWDGSKPFWRHSEMRIQAVRPGEEYPGLNVRIREREAVTALVLSMSGPYSQFDGARDRMKRYIRENGIQTTNRWFRLFNSDPSKVTPKEFKWEIGCELSLPPDGTDLRVDPPFSLRRLEKDSISFSAFRGSLDTEFPYMPFVWQVMFSGHLSDGPLRQSWEEIQKRGRTEVRNHEWILPVVPTIRLSKDEQTFAKSLSEWKDLSEIASKTVSGTETVRGYRVQLVSTTEERVSQRVWNEAMEKLKTPVYLIFEPPYRKIRVGDCRTHEEAGILLQKAVQSGFTDACIVRSDVASASASSTGDTEANNSVPGWKERLSGFFSGFSTDEPSESAIRIERTDPLWAVLLPADGSMAQHEAVFGKLKNYMNANGIPVSGTAFTRQFYSDQTVSTLELYWEAGAPVKDSVAVKPPFRCIRIPARDVIRIHFKREMDQKAMNVKLASWMLHNEYRPQYPNVLIWVNGLPSGDRIPERIEIEVPVEKMTEPFPEVRIHTRSLGDRQEILLPMTGSWKQEDEAVSRLNEFVRQNRVETLDDPFVQYHTSPEITPEKEMVWEVGVACKGEIRVPDPMRLERRHGGETACTYFTGDHTDIPRAFWHSYMLNLTSNGYFLSGYPRKVFREKLPDGKWRVELQWGVTR